MKIKYIDIILFLYILSLYMFTYRPIYNIFSNLLALLLIISIWFDIFRSKRIIYFNSFFFFQIIFLVIGLFSVFYSLDSSISLSKIITLLMVLILSFSVYNHFKFSKDIHLFIYSIVISGLIASTYILITSDFSNPDRFGSQLGNVNAIGLVLSISSVFSFFLFFQKKRWMYLFVSIMIAFTVLLTGSRKSLFLLFFGIVLMIIYLSKNKKQLFFYGFLSLLIGITTLYAIFEIPFLYIIIGERIKNLISTFFEGNNTIDGSYLIRQDMISHGLEWFTIRPLFGYGLDNFRVLYGELTGEFTYAHNNLIEILTSVGIVGFLIYLTVLALPIMNFITNKNKNPLLIPIFVVSMGYIFLSTSLVFYDSKVFSLLLSLLSLGMHKHNT